MSVHGATAATSIRWLKVWPEPNGGEFRLGRDHDDLVAEWGDVVRLTASRDGRRHELTFREELAPEHREKLERGPVRALLGHLTGGMTLHGSAVAIDGRATVFVGSSGSGKSSAAAELCRREGALLLADDLVSIDVSDGVHCVCPTDSVHWLWPDAMVAMGLSPAEWGAKVGVPGFGASAGVVSTNPLLDAIVVLRFDEAASPPSVQRLSGLECFDAINGGYVRFVIDEPDVLVRDLDQISKLCATVPVFRLTRRRDFADASKVARVLLQLAASLRSLDDAERSGFPEEVP